MTVPYENWEKESLYKPYELLNTIGKIFIVPIYHRISIMFVEQFT